jgi:hypothetical protein
MSIQDSGYSHILPLLPLEQLKLLIFHGVIAKFVECLPRLVNLEGLTFHGTDKIGEEASLPILPLPTLKKLKVVDLNEINISGLSSLISLHVSQRRRPVVITGKEEIFPKLRCINGLINSSNDLKLFQRNLDSRVYLAHLRANNIQEFVQEQQNLQELIIECQAVESAFTVGFSCKDKVNFLRMATQKNLSYNDLPKQFPRKFRNFSLRRHPSISTLPTFENLTQIALIGCYQLQNIDSIAAISCITIHDCPNIIDFSCFGASQRYLSLAGCPRLKDSDLENFGNIMWLSITGCHEITCIHEGSLLNNRYLILSFLSLKEIHLGGFSYVKVSLQLCSELISFSITGNVQFLQLYFCDKLDTQSIPRENVDFIDDDPRDSDD